MNNETNFKLILHFLVGRNKKEPKKCHLTKMSNLERITK